MPMFATHNTIKKGKPKSTTPSQRASPGHLTITAQLVEGTQTRQEIENEKEKEKGGTSVGQPGFLQDLDHMLTPNNEDRLAHRTASGDVSVLKSGKQLSVAPVNFRGERTGAFETRYQIINGISAGSYGEVKKVRDRDTNAIRALKIISKSNCLGSRNLSDEIRILQKLVGTGLRSRIIRTW